MHISDKIFTDEQLSVGKILVLEDGHKLTIAELKKIDQLRKLKKLNGIVSMNMKYSFLSV